MSPALVSANSLGPFRWLQFSEWHYLLHLLNWCEPAGHDDAARVARCQTLLAQLVWTSRTTWH